jgi:hypothetical protein
MIKKTLKIAAIAVFLLLIGLQFIRPDLTNQPVVDTERLETTTAVPENVAAVLKRACADCHTHSTSYPWYSQISPISWWLKDHVEHGRSHLNFSVWNTYSVTKRAKKLEEICEQLESKEMPLPSYLWAHRDAVLTSEDSKLLCDWATEQKGMLPQE